MPSNHLILCHLLLLLPSIFPSIRVFSKESVLCIRCPQYWISHIVAIQPRTITIGDVIGAVADHYNLPEKAIVAQNRSRDITQARHVAAYLCKELTNSSLTEIGFKMGRRTHATMLHSVAIVKSHLEFDPVMRQHIAQLEAALHA